MRRKEKNMCQIYKYIKRVEGREFSQWPLTCQVETKLPSLEVPGPIRPRQHSPPP